MREIKAGGSLTRLHALLAAGVLLWLPWFTAAELLAEAAPPRFVTSEACVTCHQDAAAQWRASHHALAWQTPDDETVLGDFDDALFQHGGAATRFTRDAGSFVVETDDGDGRARRFEVVGTAGIAPLQQVLVETEPGRLQAFDVAWDDVGKRWYHLYPELALSHEDGLHWSGPYKNWNGRCAECHATGYEKRYAPETRTYASTQAEIGVGCEACHGPGAAHVAWARAPAAFAPADWRGIDRQGLTTSLNDAEAEIQLCAGCHARREPLGSSSPPPGTPFHDAYRLALLRDGLYHADGQIRDEVYVYGSFLQSRMYAGGVRCSDCHEPHAATLRAAGNEVCTRCHGPAGNPDFPSLKPRTYDVSEHHFHEPGTPGAQCTSCHMIERVYMGIDGRRDHSFRIPRPDLSAALGTPNACTDCHGDQTAAWAAAEVAARFPDSARRGSHFATAFAAAQQPGMQLKTIAALIEIAAEDSQSGIVRASALETLAPHASPEIAQRTEALLADDDPLVRAAALPLQMAAPPALRLKRIAPLWLDPMRSVRIEAARYALDLADAPLPPSAALALQGAMREYQDSLLAKADFPEGQMVMAGTALTARRFEQAERAFAEAARMDPQMVDAWFMVARLRAAQGDAAGAEQTLERGLKFNPDNAALSQLLAEIRASRGTPQGQP